MSINSKSTKAEILAAYQELEQEKSNLQKQVELGQKQSQVQQKALENAQKIVNNPPVKSVPKPPENLSLNSMNKINNIEQVIQNLEQLQIGFGSAVSQLSEQLITEASTLEKLENDIQLELNQLQELHDLETIEDDTLNNLLATYDESTKSLFNEYNQRQEILGQELDTLKKEWLKEQENKQRENEEYQYNLTLTRQLDQENFEQELNQLYKDLQEVRQQQQKLWENREKDLSNLEKEYAIAKQKVEEFEAKLETEIKKAKEEGKGIGNYQAKIKTDLRQKEIEGETQNYQLRIQALESTILSNENRLNNLSQQLDSALKQVQDLAVKAIEGASNRNSFEAMKEVALEQAKNQAKNK